MYEPATPQSYEVTIIWLHDTQADRHWNVLTVIEEVYPSQQPAPPLEALGREGRRHPIKQTKLKSGKLLLNAFRFRFGSTAAAAAFFDGFDGVRQLKVGGCDIQLRALGQEVLYPANGKLSVPPAQAVCLGDAMEPLQRVLPQRNVTSQARVQLVLQGVESLAPWARHLPSILKHCNEWLGVDLEDARELLGATIWSRPNPYMRNLSWGLCHQGYAVLLEAYPRPGVAIPHMMVTAWGNGDLGRQPYFQASWDGGAVCFPVSDSKGRMDLKIHSDDGQLLEDRCGSFIHTINFESRISAGTRRVDIEQANGDIATQNITRWGHGSTSVIGETDDTNTALNESKRAREQQKLQENGEFVYINSFDPDAPQRAKEFVRRLFGQVKKRCIVADPYFGANELEGFAFFVANIDAHIDLITSHSHLKYIKKSGINEGQKLLVKLEQLKRQDPMFRPHITVLKGRNAPPLHDRFLVIDDRVYHLGGSLNHLGHRAMAISRVPAPERVLADLGRWINGEQSESFSTWLQNNG